MKVWPKVLLVYLILIYQNLYAVEVDRLFEAEVFVNSEREQDRVTAIEQALQRVLTRILAGDSILQDTTVSNVLANATDYVSEYQYSLAKTEHKDTRLMRVLFDEQLLVDTLRPGKKGVWNEVRPRTLVWLVVEENGVKHFFDSSEMPNVEQALIKSSRHKKIPILFPIQDLTEKQGLSTNDVLSVYSDHLLEVSTRYEVVSTLAGKLVRNNKCWKAEWTLYFNAKIKQWSSLCSSVDNVTLSGFQGVYNQLSRYYAAKPENKELASVVMKISGIKQVSELMLVTDYLEALPMIKTATWIVSSKGLNIYRVFYQGTQDALQNVVNVGRILRGEGFSKERSGELKYQFLN